MCVQAGCHFKFWVADWFAQLNNKMGGDLVKIQTVGKYMIEIWKAVGMDMRNVEFLWARYVWTESLMSTFCHHQQCMCYRSILGSREEGIQSPWAPAIMTLLLTSPVLRNAVESRS